MAEFERDLDGDGAFGGASDSLQERAHNFANEITTITDYADPTDSGSGDDLEFDYTDTGAMQQQDQLVIARSIQALANDPVACCPQPAASSAPPA